MKTKLITTLILSFLILSCGSQKEVVTIEDVEEMRVDYNRGKLKSSAALITVFQDPLQPLTTRISAMKALIATEHPDALDALHGYLQECSDINYALLTATANEVMKREYPEDVSAIVNGIASAQEKYTNYRTAVFNKLKQINVDLQVEPIFKLYQIERENYVAMQETLTTLLGSIGDERVIPILINIAKDKTLKPSVRSMAMEILGKKRHPLITETFTDMLSDPDDQLKIRDFALKATDDISDSRLIIALIEALNAERKDYYALTSALTRALGDYSDPNIVPALLKIAQSADLPQTTRRDAIAALVKFRNPEIYSQILTLMESPQNYMFYDEVYKMAKEIGGKEPLEQLRALELKAQKRAMVTQ